MENDKKHTPGPWEVGDTDINGQRIVRNRDIEIATCWHHCVGAIEKEMEVNACLISAAPELLTELKHLVALIRPVLETTNIPGLATLNGANAAISKAEGRDA